MGQTTHKTLGSDRADGTPLKPNQKAPKLSTQGRKPRRRSTKEELNRERLTAKVITCLVAGKTIEETARELDIAFSWVERVQKEIPDDFNRYFAEAKTKEIRGLIEAGIKAQLRAVMKIVEVANDEAWLKAQKAPELVNFFGIISDKTSRDLLALERSDERREGEYPSILDAYDFPF